MKRSALVLFALLGALAVPSLAKTDDGIKVGWYSQQVRPSRAVIGARIAEKAHVEVSSRATPVRPHEDSGHADRQPPPPPPYPPIASNAPILRNRQPLGPESFWYSDGAGHACMYAPNSVLPCFTVVGAATSSAGPVSPTVIAASVVRRLPLGAGQIEASPSRGGLTGVDSWFWLDPAPQRTELSVSLGGETVRVVADPDVEWRFGDGATLTGGPGVSYQPGAAPAEAIRHVYQTRCLPGDQGHNPYVLGSCGQDGYAINAVVVWRISYEAAGPVAQSGTLPARTTESSTAYRVSESRAFLVSGVTP
jgi:hypothetical protein